MIRWSRVGIAFALSAGVLWSGGVAEAGYFVSPVTVCVDASSGVVRLVASSSKCDGGTQSWSASQPAPLLCWNASSLDPQVGTRKVSVAPSSGCTAPLRLVPVDNVSLLCADGKIGLLRWPVTGSCRAAATPIRVRSAATTTNVAITIPTTTPTTAALVPSVSLSATLIDSGKFPKAAVVTANVAGTVYFIEGASPVNKVSDITSARFERWTSGVIAANTPTSIALDVDALANGYYRVFVANGQGVLSAPAFNKVTISIPRVSNVVALTCVTGGTCAVGETGPGGGVVFYVQAAGGTFDCGATLTSTCKYLEAAPANWLTGTTGDPARTWSTSANQFLSVVGADSTAIGSGYQNSRDIVAQIGNTAGTSAAVLASEYQGSGKTDWHLPSKDELSELFTNRVQVGGFSLATYWSSSEGSISGPESRLFTLFHDTSKGFNYHIRPVRAF